MPSCAWTAKPRGRFLVPASRAGAGRGPAALRYETDIGALSLAGYGTVSESRAEHKLPGQEGATASQRK